MDKLKSMIKCSMDVLSPERDIVSKARLRANSGKKPAARLVPAAVSLFAAAALCGVTVCAAVFGWTDRIFGKSASELDEKYIVSVSDTRVTKLNPKMPYDFEISEFISDGEVLYLHMNITRTDGDTPADIIRFNCVPIPQINTDSRYCDEDNIRTDFCESGWSVLDTDENGNIDAAVFISPRSGIHKGDSFRIYLGCFYSMSGDTAKNQKNDFATNNVVISFRLCENVPSMSKNIEVNKDAVFERYSENDPAITEHINNIELSPLKLSVSGYHYGRRTVDYYGYSYADGISFIMKDGNEKKPELLTDVDGGAISVPVSNADADKYDKHNEYEFCTRYHFKEVISIDEIEAVRIGDLTVPVK